MSTSNIEIIAFHDGKVECLSSDEWYERDHIEGEYTFFTEDSRWVRCVQYEFSDSFTLRYRKIQESEVPSEFRIQALLLT